MDGVCLPPKALKRGPARPGMEWRGAYKKYNVGAGLHVEKCLEELTAIFVTNPVASGFLARIERTLDHVWCALGQYN
jgi:hypothetical protein